MSGKPLIHPFFSAGSRRGRELLVRLGLDGRGGQRHASDGPRPRPPYAVNADRLGGPPETRERNEDGAHPLAT